MPREPPRDPGRDATLGMENATGGLADKDADDDVGRSEDWRDGERKEPAREAGEESAPCAVLGDIGGDE